MTDETISLKLPREGVLVLLNAAHAAVTDCDSNLARIDALAEDVQLDPEGWLAKARAETASQRAELLRCVNHLTAALYGGGRS